MKFKQKEDGSCDLIFSQEEIDVMNKHKKIHFTPESIKHFGNCLQRMIWEFNSKLDSDLQNMMTYDNSVCEGVEPKDD